VFNFIVKYFGLLKHIPVFPHVFDGYLKIQTLFFNKKILDYIDDIENEVLSWKNTSIQLHKFGGVQFNLNKKELGHIHGNGILDILFNRKIKSQLIQEGKVEPHHVFKDSGWITFRIQTEQDKKIAIELLRYSYSLSKI
jgi:hypothetical protein